MNAGRIGMLTLSIEQAEHNRAVTVARATDPRYAKWFTPERLTASLARADSYLTSLRNQLHDATEGNTTT